MTAFFFDTNSELLWTKAKELNLTNIIKMPYTVCGIEYFYDLGESYDAKWFFDLVRQGNMPITSALNPEDYKTYFEPFFKNGEDIFYLSFSAEMSATFKYMDLAVEELSKTYPNVKFIRYDSKAISMAAGLQVYAAAKAFNEGKSIDEIIELLNELAPRVNAYIVVDDLQHLKRGGRLSGAQAFIAGILKIKPIVKLVVNGTLAVKEKVPGLNKALLSIATETITKVKDLDKYPIVVLDADAKNEGDRLLNMLKEALPNAEIWRQSVGPVIGAHCGPGTVAIVFVGSERPV
ncbi:MAG: DegV family protein [Christensenellaceae bacterium]|nr:DegV family protein [Christensenellaceae bacterium]